MLKGLKKRIYSSDFLKSLAVLMTGTIIAQSIGYLVAPVITRLYTPEEIGEFAFFQRIVILIATLATARYELALPLPKKNQQAFQLFRFSMKLTLISTFLSTVAALLYGLMNDCSNNFYLLIITGVVSVFAIAFFNLGTNWAIRMKSFKRISFSKMTNSLSQNGLRVLFGLLGWGYLGLVVSFVMSFIIGATHFIADFFKWKKTMPLNPENKKDITVAREYKNFPFASLPHALTDTLRDVLVAFVIIDLFSEGVFGSFDHSYRMLRLPIMIIGVSMSQVFFNRASELKNQGQKILPIFSKLVITLGLISIVPFTLIFFFGGDLFAFVFGEEWYQSGKLSEIMAPWLMLNFVLSPLSTIPLVLNKQGTFFLLGLSASLLQLAGFLFLPCALGYCEGELFNIFNIVTWSQVLMSILILIYLFTIVRKHDELLK